MFLSNRDIKWAIVCHKLIADPPPEAFQAGYDETSIDLHLDVIQRGARVWDIEAYRRDEAARTSSRGSGAARASEIAVGGFDWETLSGDYLIEVPARNPTDEDQLVFQREGEVVVRPSGFLLWTTKERVGTPKINPTLNTVQVHPELICFVNAKSTRARIGILVHFTAPTIHAGWAGRVTLEIANLGPFDFVLREDDVIAQLTVATISSAPDLSLRKNKQQTQDQMNPSGAPRPKKGPPKRQRPKPQ